MVERKAARRSFLEVSCSGEEEKRSVRPVGVHAEPGSKEEATDSVVLALDKRPVRMNVKSKVGLEVTPDDIDGGHDVGTVVAGETLFCGKKLRVSILVGSC